MEITVTNAQQTDRILLIDTVCLGRDPSGDDHSQILVVQDGAVSRNQMAITQVDASHVGIENLSQKIDIRVELPADGPIVRRGAESGDAPRVLEVPIRLSVGRTVVEINEATPADEAAAWQTLAHSPSLAASPQVSTPAVSLAECDDAEVDAILGWLEQLVGVLKAAAGSDAFYQEAAEAVVSTIGLDCGMVLLREAGGWKQAARFSRSGRFGQHSTAVLDAIVQQRQTIYQRTGELDARDSLLQVSGFVASPIFDRQHQEVVGVLYGFRFGDAGSQPILQSEAHMAQVLASAVASGLARQHSDQEALRQQVQFEQFVSPEVARELNRNPQALHGRETVITALFSDIRNFSAASEKLDAAQLFQWIRDVMNCLAERVREFGGTTCGFLGDGLLAMWNAPVECENHAELACRAALAMISDLPALNRQWSERIGGPVGIGVGINTGAAMVGNTGCDFKPNYGPLGDTVNLASRVEGATKKLGAPILITESTQRLIPADFATRRLCRVRVVGREQPASLYELASDEASESWQAYAAAYQTALEQFEQGHWLQASENAFQLLKRPDGSSDQPALALVSRAIECLQSPPPQFDPVWEFFSK